MAETSEALIASLRHIEPATSVEESLARLLKTHAEEKRRKYRELAERRSSLVQPVEDLFADAHAAKV